MSPEQRLSKDILSTASFKLHYYFVCDCTCKVSRKDTFQKSETQHKYAMTFQLGKEKVTITGLGQNISLTT